MDRTLIIPENISPGIYELKVLLGKFGRGFPKHSPGAPPGDEGAGNFFADGVSGVNLLNADGFSEVFRLKNGIVDQPMIKEVDWAGLIDSGITWANASTPVVLGKFSIEPHGS